MEYKVKRFSYTLVDGINQGGEYIQSGVSTVHDISTQVTEDPRLKDITPVKRYGGLIRNLSYLLKKKKKRKEKK